MLQHVIYWNLACIRSRILFALRANSERDQYSLYSVQPTFACAGNMAPSLVAVCVSRSRTSREDARLDVVGVSSGEQSLELS